MSKAKHVSEQEAMETADEVLLSELDKVEDFHNQYNQASVQKLTLRLAFRTAVALERIADNLDNIAEAADQVEE